MKKTLIALSALAVAFSFTACNDDDIITTGNDTPQAKTIIKACTEAPATRTALSKNDDGYDVVWSEGDKFTLGGNVFALTAGKGTTTGTFEGTLPVSDGTYDAWYGVSSATLPTVQAYKADAIANSPMHASVTVTESEAGTVEFKNLCGLLMLSLKGAATIRTITVTANEALAGAFTVNDDGGAEMSDADTFKSITLDCGTGVTLDENAATDFFIAMPANATGYTGVSIKLTDTDSKVLTKTLKSDYKLVVNRSQITTASFTTGTFTAPRSVYGHAYVALAGNYWGTENVYAATDATAKDAGESGYGSYYVQSEAEKAAESWTGVWALPTEEQWQALLDGCNWTWMTDYKFGGKAMNGYLVTDKTDISKFIFLPAAGYSWSSVEYKNKEILYWSTDYDSSQTGDKGRYLYAYYDDGTAPNVKYGNEATGFSVRPVAVPLVQGAKVKIDGHYGIVVVASDDNMYNNSCIYATMNVGATAEDGPGCLGEQYPLQDYYEGWEGWRVPTEGELQGLAYDYFEEGYHQGNGVNYSDNAVRTGGEGEGYGGTMIWNYGGNKLYLPMQGVKQYWGTHDAYYNVPFGVYWTTGDGGEGSYLRFRFLINYKEDGWYNYDSLGDCGYEPMPEEAPRVRTNGTSNLVPETDPCYVRLVHDLPVE